MKKPLFFLLICFYACGGPFPEKHAGTILQKIPLSHERVYDLSGYAGGGAQAVDATELLVAP